MECTELVIIREQERGELYYRSHWWLKVHLFQLMNFDKRHKLWGFWNESQLTKDVSENETYDDHCEEQKTVD